MKNIILNKAKVYSIITVMSLISIVSGCSFFDARDPNTISDWVNIPAIGTEYRYQTIDDDTETGEYSMTIINCKQHDGTVTLDYKLNAFEDTFYIIFDDNLGMMFYQCNDKEIKPERDPVYLATPIELNNTWIIVDGYIYEYTITRVNARKIVRAGEFKDCIVIECELLDQEFWYSPSIAGFIYKQWNNDKYEELKYLSIPEQ